MVPTSPNIQANISMAILLFIIYLLILLICWCYSIYKAWVFAHCSTELRYYGITKHLF